MKKVLIIGLLAAMLASGVGCTNMNKTQQGVASGAALGALGGAGIAAISGGAAGWGALAGAGVALWLAVLWVMSRARVKAGNSNA